MDTGGSLFIGNLKPEGRQGRGATCKVLGMPPGDQKAAERKPSMGWPHPGSCTGKSLWHKGPGRGDCGVSSSSGGAQRKVKPSFLQLQTSFPFAEVLGASEQPLVRTRANEQLTKGLQLHPTHQERARAHQVHRKNMNKSDTQQKMTSSLLHVRYQGTSFLKGTWAQRQNKE